MQGIRVDLSIKASKSSKDLEIPKQGIRVEN